MATSICEAKLKHIGDYFGHLASHKHWIEIDRFNCRQHFLRSCPKNIADLQDMIRIDSGKLIFFNAERYYVSWAIMGKNNVTFNCRNV